MEQLKLNTIEEALDDFRDGKFVIVVDDEDRENEGDLICAAEKITPEMVNFMLKNARGVLCAPVTISRAAELELSHQVQDNTSLLGTPFTVTVDKIEGCSTGVSAHDRAATIRERSLSWLSTILVLAWNWSFRIACTEAMGALPQRSPNPLTVTCNPFAPL